MHFYELNSDLVVGGMFSSFFCVELRPVVEIPLETNFTSYLLPLSSYLNSLLTKYPSGMIEVLLSFMISLTSVS